MAEFGTIVVREVTSCSDNKSANRHCRHEQKATTCHHASLAPACPPSRSTSSAVNSQLSWECWERFPIRGPGGERSTGLSFVLAMVLVATLTGANACASSTVGPPTSHSLGSPD